MILVDRMVSFFMFALINVIVELAGVKIGRNKLLIDIISYYHSINRYAVVNQSPWSLISSLSEVLYEQWAFNARAIYIRFSLCEKLISSLITAAFNITESHDSLMFYYNLSKA